MEIAFRTKVLRNVCLSGDAMDEQFGPERAQLLRDRLADMRAAVSLQDISLMHAQPIKGTFGSEVSIDLGRGLTVVLKANYTKPPRSPDGSVDWTRVERVLVQRIERVNG